MLLWRRVAGATKQAVTIVLLLVTAVLLVRWFVLWHRQEDRRQQIAADLRLSEERVVATNNPYYFHITPDPDDDEPTSGVLVDDCGKIAMVDFYERRSGEQARRGSSPVSIEEDVKLAIGRYFNEPPQGLVCSELTVAGNARFMVCRSQESNKCFRSKLANGRILRIEMKSQNNMDL